LENIEEGTGISSLKGKSNKSTNPEVAKLRATLQARKSRGNSNEQETKQETEQESTPESPTFSTDDTGHEHAPAGSGKGGQFVKKGSGGSSIGKIGKIHSGDKPPGSYTQGQRRIEKTGGPGGIGPAISGAVSGAIRGALIGGKAGATGKPEMVSRDEHDRVIDKALSKLEKVIEPTPQEIAENKDGIERLGANIFRRNLVGNTKDRRRRREKLLKEFGDGVKCPCIYCGILLSGNGDLEQDKIFTTEEGGRYRMSNLVPACKPCNNRRGDMPFIEAMQKVVQYAGN
jgi:hypothetical protein